MSSTRGFYRLEIEIVRVDSEVFPNDHVPMMVEVLQQVLPYLRM
jgi:hypothetical protein